MPLPSKQNMIYSLMRKKIRENYKPGDKLPSEVQLAAEIGVARRSLRSTLSRLAEEGLIQRTNRGTFLRDTAVESNAGKNPVYILVPCPNYYTASGFYSAYLIQQMIQGCVRSAVEHGTYAVTLPITKDNNPDNVIMSQFNHLRKGDIVIFNGHWATDFYSILEKKKCRLGIVSGCAENGFEKSDLDFYHLYWGNYWDCLGDAVMQLHKDGAKKIVYFGRKQTDISKRGKPFFLDALTNAGLDSDEKYYILYDAEISFRQSLQLLKETYQTLHFDGLIFDSNLYDMPATIPDFFQETGIPETTKLICSVSEFLRSPGLPPQTRILHRPQKTETKEMVDVLLSGKQRRVSKHGKYQFPLIADFLEETNFLER